MESTSINKIEVPNYLPIIGKTDIRTLIDKRYYLGRKVCYHIYDNPKDVQSFEDLYHTTLFNAIKCLDKQKMDQDEMINYFMRAYRNNLIRQYQYAYRKNENDIDFDKMMIPVNNEHEIQSHLDGWQMIEMVKKKYGDYLASALLDQLNGFTYETISKKYDINAFYELGKIKKFLKEFYTIDANYYMNSSGILLPETYKA